MRNSRDRVGFEIEASSSPRRVLMDEEEPFRIALLGDFSGRKERGPVAGRKAVLVDRDNIDAVLRKIEPVVELSAGAIAISDIEDFHPDHIYGTYPLFDELRRMRRKLADPETFADGARELLGEKPAAVPTLEDLIGGAGAAPRAARAVDPLKKLIEEAVRPHLVAREDPRAPELIRQVDAAAADLMRAILHSRKFQALEAAWTAVYQVVRALETGPELKVYLLDVSRAELADDPDALFEILVNQSGPWSVIAGNYALGAEDLPLLTVLGVIARKAGAPFVAEADLSLIGSDDYAAFRRTGEAKHIGLALPGVLVRMPYGAKSSPCESFDFEEIPGKPDAKQMLYGSPAFYCAMLLGEGGGARDISGRPLFVYDDDGESRSMPVAEIALTQDQAEALIGQGFIPIASYRDRDFARVLMWQNVADPPSALL